MMSGDLSFPSDLADTQSSTEPNPKVWGRRAYAGKSSRELLNDVSRAIAQTDPDHVDDHKDPSLADVIQQAKRGVDPNVKGSLLADLLGQGLDFQEAVCWYWYRHAQFDVTEIHFAMEGYDHGGDPDVREEHVGRIVDTLRSAASKLDVDIDLDY
jgi:hypothetical protein